MLPVAGHTTGPNGRNFFVDTHRWPGVSKAQKKRHVLVRIVNKLEQPQTNTF